MVLAYLFEKAFLVPLRVSVQLQKVHSGRFCDFADVHNHTIPSARATTLSEVSLQKILTKPTGAPIYF